MTVTTDDGIEVVGDLLIGNVSGRIDAIAVGTGSGSESRSSTALASEVYRADAASSNSEFVETDATGGFELVLRVKGGSEVSSGTTITELGAFFEGSAGGGTLVFVDEFAGVTVEEGFTEEFRLPVDSIRG